MRLRRFLEFLAAMYPLLLLGVLGAALAVAEWPGASEAAAGFVPPKALDMLGEMATSLVAMAPYLLFGFLVAGILAVAVSPEMVERHLGGRGIWPVVKAAAFGVPLPLCSCGVIPVSASLRRHGASRGATTAFLLSTPQTGVDSIMVTLSLLGPVFAIFRPVAALATGVFGGALVAYLEHERGARMEPDGTEDAHGMGGVGGRLARVLTYGFYTLPQDIGRALLLGLVVAGAIAAALPHDLATLYGSGFLGMLVMMAVGIPIYVCATASVPIAAALIAKGVSPGAALAFLITGPATNAATIAVVWKTMGRRTAFIYLASVALAALGCGALLDLIYRTSGAAAAPHVHEMVPGWLSLAAAVLLLLVVGAAIYWRPGAVREEKEMPAEKAEAVELAIEGMTCSHCVASVTRALRACPNVVSAAVDLKRGRATVRGSGLDRAALRKAVEAAGYTVGGP